MRKLSDSEKESLKGKIAQHQVEMRENSSYYGGGTGLCPGCQKISLQPTGVTCETRERGQRWPTVHSEYQCSNCGYKVWHPPIPPNTTTRNMRSNRGPYSRYYYIFGSLALPAIYATVFIIMSILANEPIEQMRFPILTLCVCVVVTIGIVLQVKRKKAKGEQDKSP